MYTSADYDPNGKYPAITVAHPNGGTKEQVAGRYAQRLAEQGYITITADAAYQGHSDGEPRSVDKPFIRTYDIHGMADFIAAFSGVDVDRLSALGICGGGGYTLKAAQSDKRFKSGRDSEDVQLGPGPSQRAAGLCAGHHPGASAAGIQSPRPGSRWREGCLTPWMQT